jgi:hypothetical protein
MYKMSAAELGANDSRLMNPHGPANMNPVHGP